MSFLGEGGKENILQQGKPDVRVENPVSLFCRYFYRNTLEQGKELIDDKQVEITISNGSHPLTISLETKDVVDSLIRLEGQIRSGGQDLVYDTKLFGDKNTVQAKYTHSGVLDEIRVRGKFPAPIGLSDFTTEQVARDFIAQDGKDALFWNILIIKPQTDGTIEISFESHKSDVSGRQHIKTTSAINNSKQVSLGLDDIDHFQYHLIAGGEKIEMRVYDIRKEQQSLWKMTLPFQLLGKDPIGILLKTATARNEQDTQAAFMQTFALLGIKVDKVIE